MLAIRPLLPLLIAAGILLAGNGLLGTLIALRGAEEGFSTTQIGFMGTTYFLGFMAGCYIVPVLLRTVGHIRTFSALAAIAASGTLMMVVIIDAPAWMVLRFILGLCFSGLFTTVDSWINLSVSNAIRGKVLSLYRIIDILSVTSVQFLIPVIGTEGITLFALMTILTCLSLVPVALGDRSRPKPPDAIKFDLAGVWAISPMACLGCITIGMTNSAFRLVGPIYAQEVGLSIAGVATFMSAGIFGGAVLQYPLGLLSDRFDRRLVLVAATAMAVASSLFLSFGAEGNETLLYVGIFLFGAFSLPLYSLSAAHANDRATGDQFVLVAAGLIFFFSFGATIGPMAAALLIEQFGASALFNYTGAAHSVLIVIAMWRMTSRSAVPVGKRPKFVGLMRTSLFLAKIGRKKGKQK
ncbi:MAG: MFS transporter [Rhizobiaceae bacterium]